MLTRTTAPHHPPAARLAQAALLGQWALACSAVWALLAVLPLYLMQDSRLGAGAAAALVTEAVLCLRLMRIVAGPVLVRLSPAGAVRGALLLGAAAFGVLALCGAQVWALAVLLPLIGLGFGMNALALKLIAAAAPATEHSTRFAAQAVALNAGMALGPLAGLALFHAYGATALFLGAALVHVAALGLALAVRTPDTGPSGAGVPLRALLPLLVRDRGLRFPLALTAIGFVLYAQLFATLPLYARDVLARPGLIGTVFVVNGVLIVALQMPVTLLAKRWGLGPTAVSAAGFGCFAAAFGCLAAGHSPAWLFTGVVLATLGEMLVMPSLDVLVGAAGPADRRVAYFSLAALAVALGEAVGSFTGVNAAGSDVSGTVTLYWCLTAAAAVTAASVAVRRPPDSR